MNEQKIKERGITLVALVVTIIVLLILSGVTITVLFSDDGIIRKAQQAAEATNTAVEDEIQGINNLGEQMNTVLNGSGTGTGTGGNTEDDNPPIVEPPKVEDNFGAVISATENTDLEDSYGNKITVPAGFYIVTPTQDSTVTYDYSDDGTPTVQDGIVIQNEADGNQFVWVPIGDINNKDGSTTTIKLGRYEDFTMSGTTLPTPAQEATESCYNTAVLIGTSDFFEVSDSFAGSWGAVTIRPASNYKNTKATNLQEWISTSLANGGYYIARYEASQNTTEATKAASVKGVSPWGSITQPNAAIAAKATYAVDGINSSNYYSDLINSYAWDTAIVFIQAYEDSSYASKNYSTSYTTTGTNPDKVCNINDMSGNACEWSTETARYLRNVDDSSSALSYCQRGGTVSGYDGLNGFLAYTRYSSMNFISHNYCSFRLTLYVK